MQQIKGWHREDIKAEIRKRGTTLRALSLNAGLSICAGTVALKKPFPSAQRVVSEFLNIPLHTLWPQWYDESGQRIDARSNRKTSRKKRAGQCKKKPGQSA